ncbi:hypothetical protein KCTC32516_00197 [Polaribacter huanghezhanensis]|uniref:T9SS type A sorting domain-containing protein n=1 Tax=Polaribacter huanghezhanensis TaxID=1354726 RepID=UPI0026477F80|nr:T9SS type A sorting domain-containing protein [Polaribacter huanghezhanensis]WKD84861.1 hypothetical protein KCTC32516_00197 [Polaribacter huanghezhanensis]
MRHLSLLFLLIMSCFPLHAQIENITEKYDLPNAVSETSGLLFLNGKLITHNDSGDAANLYELDTITGNIIRTINISNATNVDWEDITQDDTYIYIGDFGNNSNGNRQDLKIYRILKSDFTNSTSITSETIAFSYEDQTDFASQPNNSNFDAEAISVYKDKLVIFTKNWKDNTVNAYTIPKIIGNHSAKKVSSYTSNGLITGSTYNKDDDSFLLCGYTTNGAPFLIYIKVNAITNDAIFSGVIERTDINPTLGPSQIEGITAISGEKYFLSREKVEIGGTVLTQKLYRFDNGSFSPLHIDDVELTRLQVFPNPSQEILFIKGLNLDIKQLFVIDINGKTVINQKNSNNQILIKELTIGTYFLKIALKNNTIITKKFIKN